MTQLSSRPAAGRSPATPARQALPGLPRTGLTPQQQLEALARVQNQAEQRVKLGLQLFKAAEAHTSSQRDILDELAAEREKFREELTQDVTRSLHAFDQWIGQMDDTFTQAFLTLEERVDAVEQRLSESQSHLHKMISQTQKMLDQAMALLDGQGASPVLNQMEHEQFDEEVVVQLSQTAKPVQRDYPTKLINPVPPVKLVVKDLVNRIEPVPPRETNTTADPATAIPTASNQSTQQMPVVQSVSYADILDRIYESRKQLKQDQQTEQ